ncbi:uncharacterized protein LOC135480934 [Liolophura sinensis]|uniref:uncharacterized protein LOC135480934 n=1 Tax=Liolophura sinensis TaxID=3198878 RepID=UPI0031593523
MAASQPPKVPPGNWIARQLKRINDESHGKVIPQTAASQRSANKYNSVYDVHYSSMNEELLCQFLKQKEDDAAERLKIEEARETVGDVFGVKRARKADKSKQAIPKANIFTVLPHVCKFRDTPVLYVTLGTHVRLSSISEKTEPLPAIQMFSAWKVPKRLNQDIDIPFSKKMDALCEDVESVQISGRRSADLRSRQGGLSPSRLPMLGHRRSKSTAAPGGGRRTATRDGSLSPRRSVRSSARSRLGEPGPQELSNVFQPHAVYKADDILQRAPLDDRKTIQKILRMAEKKHQDEHAVKQGVQPDVQAPIANWLKGASEKDRAVALDFFKSLTGTKLIGHTGAEQSARLQDVIHALEGNKEARSLATPRPDQKTSRSTELHSSLKHLRLLSPQSRKNRWMETTWHHLPEYQHTDPVNNWSSVYTRPHGFIPRHFTIHPEWG